MEKERGCPRFLFPLVVYIEVIDTSAIPPQILLIEQPTYLLNRTRRCLPQTECPTGPPSCPLQSRFVVHTTPRSMRCQSALWTKDGNNSERSKMQWTKCLISMAYSTCLVRGAFHSINDAI